MWRYEQRQLYLELTGKRHVIGGRPFTKSLQVSADWKETAKNFLGVQSLDGKSAACQIGTIVRGLRECEPLFSFQADASTFKVGPSTFVTPRLVDSLGFPFSPKARCSASRVTPAASAVSLIPRALATIPMTCLM
nr:hypothetical protein [Rhodovulum sulfidophilum]